MVNAQLNRNLYKKKCLVITQVTCPKCYNSAILHSFLVMCSYYNFNTECPAEESCQ